MAPTAVKWCITICRWFPVLFITAVIVWSYYAYVIQMCIFTVESIPEKILYLVIYHPLLVMFVWSYWKAIFADPDKVPKQFFLSDNEIHRFETGENEEIQRQILAKIARDRDLPVQNRTVSGAYRYCEKCKCIKPDRAHHCSVCGQCILKMDHHCPWVNNCVCFNSYKFFIIFLGYGLLYCLYVASTVIKYFIEFWTGGAGQGMGRFHILFLFFASVMFSISLLSLFGYHCFLVSRNRSTLESFRAPVFRSGPDKDGWNLGAKANFQEVFGDNRKTWFLPIYTTIGDGVSYPSRVDPNTASSYNTIGDTTGSTASPSFGDGVTYPSRNFDDDSDKLLGQRQRWAEEGEEPGRITSGSSSQVQLISE